MTLAELYERIGWQLEGRLLALYQGGWHDRDSSCNPPSIDENASNYRRRPDAPEMPSEVWVAPATPECHMGVYLDKCGEGQVRYIRADGTIDGSRLEGRHKDDAPGKWVALSCCEYRFKP